VHSLVGDLGTEASLDLVRVDDTGNISVGEESARELVSALLSGGLLVGAVERVEALEGVTSPDNETTEMTTRGELEEVEAANAGELNTGQVSESLGERGFLVVDNEGATTLDVTSVSQLALSSSELLGVLHLGDVSESTDSFQESDSLRGLGDGVDGLVVNDEGNLGDLLDLVTASEDESGDGRSSEGGDQSVTALVHADLAVPSSPGLGGCKHSTTAAHIAEGTLAGSVSTTTGHARNTCNGATSTPRLSGRLVTSVLRDGVRLSLVLGHSGVNIVNDVSSDGSGEDCGESHILVNFGVAGSVDANEWSAGHDGR